MTRARWSMTWALPLLLAHAACASFEPNPSSAPPPSEPAPTTTPVAPGSPTPPIPAEPMEGGWYEVDRVGDLEGNETRTLLVGSLRGTLTASIPLGAQVPAERRDGREAFAWTDPQANGIFAGRVLVWGRDGDQTAIEAVDVADGEIQPLVQAPEDSVHVATADASLSRVFFVTVDEASNSPTGIWVASPESGEPPMRLTHRFGPELVTNRFSYRLVANADGSRLAIQGAEGPVTLFDVDSDRSVEINPGGPVIGFADDQVVAYGAASAEGFRAVFAFDPSTLQGREISEQATSAQVVPGTDGDLVASMHQDLSDQTRFAIEAIVVRTGERGVAYTNEPGTFNQGLASRHRNFLGAELPPDWVILVDSFFPYIQAPDINPRPVPETGHPLLLNLRTRDTLRVGPFVTGSSQ